MNRSKIPLVLAYAVVCALQVGNVLAQKPPRGSLQAEVKPKSKATEFIRHLPRSVMVGLTDSETHITMVPLDMVAIGVQDAERNSEEKALRIGVVRTVPEISSAKVKTSAGQWQALPDGSHVWRLALTAESAFGIRIHIGQIVMPETCEIAVFSTTDPSRLRGPYPISSLHGRNEFWTGTVFSENVTAEFYCPPGVSPANVQFVVDKMVHIYRDPLALAKEGNCNIDLACHPSWAATGNAVAGIGSISDGWDYMWCTGCLLNDEVPSTYVDYFMTANHCVGSQTEADDTEFYWFFQTDTCNGIPPSLASIPMTDGGADYLAGQPRNAGNDFAFLRLRRASPGGVTYAGWSTNTPLTSEVLAGIHHPDGTFKRISFGNRISGSTANFWDVRWSAGITEPGSSGSPLFNASQQFIGQLYGGYSACYNPAGIDEYGRFNVSYALIYPWPSGEIPPPSFTYFSLNQSVNCTGEGWSRTYVVDLTHFQNLAVQDGYQNYAITYSLYYNIWYGIYIYDYNRGIFSALTWLINLNL